MKKLFTKILSVMISAALVLTVLAGCDLITTNTDRDMDQVVANVSVDPQISEDIYKRELQAAFNSYGATYMNYYGYTEAQTYKLLLDNLVDNRIIAQYSKIALTQATAEHSGEGYFQTAAKVAAADRTLKDECLTALNYDGKAFAEVKATSPAKDFMTEYEYNYARYSVLTSVDSVIKSLMDEETDEDDPHETLTVTVRTTLTVPTDEDGNEVELKKDEEISKISETYKRQIEALIKEAKLDVKVEDYTNRYDLNLAVYKDYIAKFDLTSKDRKKALKKAIKLLADQGLITSDEAAKSTPATVDEVLELTAFKDTLVRQYESLIVVKYRLALQNEKEKIVNEDTLYSEYSDLYAKQEAAYKNDVSAYESALSSMSDTSPVLYHTGEANAKNGYGFVSNLLIGFSAEQTAALSAYKSKNKVTESDIKNYRESLLEKLTVKDLRSTWVMSNYGTFDTESGEFTFGNDYVKTDSLKKYQGLAIGTAYDFTDSNGLDTTNYYFTSVTPKTQTFANFYALLAGDMGLDTAFAAFKDGDATTVKQILNAAKAEDATVITDALMEKYRDYVYAFSTDSGSLTENYGYVYSPVTSATTYVKEFAAAAKAVVEKGVGAYTIVATDYGYHIILCTKVLEGSKKLTADEFKAQLAANDENSIAVKFKDYKLDVVVASEVSNVTSAFINNNRTSSVKYYEKTFSDIIPEGTENPAA